MSIFGIFIYVMEFMGTVAFAISGASLGIRRGMDLFGVVILGTVTAIGGGALCDVILGIHPPSALVNPRDIIFAIITSILVFTFSYLKVKAKIPLKDKILFFMDSIGVSIFTVIGVNRAFAVARKPNFFLLVFVGLATGTCGGMMRDVLAGQIPFIFRKHIYSAACIAGAFLCVVLWQYIHPGNAMVIGGACIFVLRFLGDYFNWNLPRIDVPANDFKKLEDD